jgi:hypothetical protein
MITMCVCVCVCVCVCERERERASELERTIALAAESLVWGMPASLSQIENLESALTPPPQRAPCLEALVGCGLSASTKSVAVCYLDRLCVCPPRAPARIVDTKMVPHSFASVSQW